jgi:hypothetical protein
MKRSRIRSTFGVALTLGFVVLTMAIPTADARTSASITCDQSDPSGHLLVQERTPRGEPEVDLIVTDPATADTLGTITIPAVDAVYPTKLPHRALAIAGRELYLVDSAELTATIIPLDGEPATDLAPNPVQFRGSSGMRFVLLGSPSFDRAYLIDVESGTATSLTDLIPPAAPEAPVSIPFAAVTPDDAHVVLWDGQHVHVVATDNPTEARQVDTGAFAFAPDFSPDGQELIFSQSEGPGSGSTLVLESIDGATSDEIKTSDRAMVTLWVPESRSILVDERTETGAAAGSAYLLDLESGDETPLVKYTGSLTTVQFSPDGTSALLGVEMVGAGTWYLADLSSGEVEELSQLAGNRVLPGLYADSRWALAVPLSDESDPLAGPTYRGVDLETGDVGRLLQQPDDMIFLQQPVMSMDGRYSLVLGQTDTRQTLWLLDAVELRSVELADGASVTGLFSPDACHVAVTTETAVDGIPSYAVSIRSSDGAPITEINAVAAMVWTSGQ